MATMHPPGLTGHMLCPTKGLCCATRGSATYWCLARRIPLALLASYGRGWHITMQPRPHHPNVPQHTPLTIKHLHICGLSPHTPTSIFTPSANHLGSNTAAQPHSTLPTHTQLHNSPSELKHSLQSAAQSQQHKAILPHKQERHPHPQTHPSCVTKTTARTALSPEPDTPPPTDTTSRNRTVCQGRRELHDQ
jgi:hypothetical protein